MHRLGGNSPLREAASKLERLAAFQGGWTGISEAISDLREAIWDLIQADWESGRIRGN
jgi:hypothetical protein